MNFFNISDYISSPEYILLEKSFYDLKILSAAKTIYNLIYDPYENNTHNKILNNLENIISTELNKYGEKLYEYEKEFKDNKSKIRYFFKSVFEKIKNDFKNANNLFIKKENEILKIYNDLGDLAKNVKVILEKIDGSKREITLTNLKNIINGDIFRKQHFYASIRGYTVSDYGIEEVDPNQKFEQTTLFKEIITKEMPNAFKNNENLLKDSEFYFPIINEDIEIGDLIDKSIYDIVFVNDSTNSMKRYINAVTEKCRDIVDEINNSFANEKQFKYGAILYRDILDNKNSQNILIELTPDKEILKSKLENVKTQDGGDYAEDWNSAYLQLINDMNWTRDKSVKIVIHIADASTHGKEFTSKNESDHHPEEGTNFIKTIEKVAKKGIKIIGCPIKKIPIHCYQKFMEIYKLNNVFFF